MSEKAALPMVSVVIPTHRRRDSTERAIRSVLACDYPRERFEILVVDGLSDDGTEQMLEALHEETEGRVRYWITDPLGPSASRNLGAREAVGSILAFIDSDCEADPGWLRNGVAAFDEAPEVGIVQGRVEPPPGVPLTLRSRYVLVQGLNGVFEACSIFYRKAAFDSVQGFSDRFYFDPRPRGLAYRLFPWLEGPVSVLKYTGEDTDLGWKVRAAGWEARFCGEAIVFHEVRVLSPLRWLVDEACYSCAAPYLARIHPPVRKHLYRRLFIDRNHAFFILLLAGLLLGISTHWGFALLALPYVLSRGAEPSRFFRGPTRLFRFLVHLPRDAVSFAVLAVSSCKARSLVL